MTVSGPITQSAYSSALEGVSRAREQMLDASRSIANGDLDSLPESFLSLTVAKTAHAANLKVIEALDETERHLLDIFA